MSENHSTEKSERPSDAGEAPARVPPQASQPPAEKGTFASIVLILGCALGQICMVGGANVQIMLPSIERDLNIPQSKLLWPVTAYSLTAGCFLLPLGRLADIYGRKRGFLIGIAWYMVWSIASGFSQSLIQMAIFRALQGIGAAAVIPAAVGILAQEFPPGRMRSIAFATFSCGAPLGGSISTLLGGTVTQLSAPRWRTMFFVLCGMIAPSAATIFLVVPKDRRDKDTDKRVDWIGAAIVTVALVLLLFVLAQGEVASNGWKTGYIIALLIVSVLGIGCFIAWEWYLEERTTFPPLMSLRLWKRAKGRFAAMQVIAFFTFVAFFSWSYWVTLYYQNYLGLSPVLAMIRFIPMFVSGATCNFIVAMVIGRISGAILLAIGAAATGAGCVLFAVINTSSPYWAFGFPSAALVVLGADFIFATGSIFVARVALPGEQSLAGGIFNTVMQVGGAVGLAITGVVADQVTTKESKKLGVDFNPRDPGSAAAPLPALLKGYRAAQWTCFAFCMTSMVLVLIFLRGIGRVGHHAKPATQATEDVEKQPAEDVSSVETATQPADASPEQKV